MGDCGGRGIPSFIIVSCAMFTKLWRAPINYLKLSCFLLYPLTVWHHICTGCSQGGKITFGNTLCTFKGVAGVSLAGLLIGLHVYLNLLPNISQLWLSRHTATSSMYRHIPDGAAPCQSVSILTSHTVTCHWSLGYNRKFPLKPIIKMK